MSEWEATVKVLLKVQLTLPVSVIMFLMVIQYQKMGGDQRALRQRIFEIVNFVNMVSFLRTIQTGSGLPYGGAL